MQPPGSRVSMHGCYCIKLESPGVYFVARIVGVPVDPPGINGLFMPGVFTGTDRDRVPQAFAPKDGACARRVYGCSYMGRYPVGLLRGTLGACAISIL